MADIVYTGVNVSLCTEVRVCHQPGVRVCLPIGILVSMSDEQRIDAVAAGKGGVGKTTLAYEVAFQTDAVLVDLDWDKGGATRAWGYRTENRVRSPLLEALESGGKKIPRYMQGKGSRPDLLPGHEDFGLMQPTAEKMADLLETWAQAWGRDVVVDTHPGGVSSTMGAMAAARSILVPNLFEEKPMEGLEGLLEQLGRTYPLLIVPNRVKGVIPDSYMQWLTRLSSDYQAPVVQYLEEFSWIPRRKLRRAISSEPVPKRAEDFVLQVAAVVKEMKKR